MDLDDGKLCKKEMVEEMEALDNNEACDLEDLMTGRNPIGSKLVFKKKLNVEGEVEKYKAQLVAKGYSWVEGIDFGEMFSPLSKLNYVRFILIVAIAFDFKLE
jgi:hypothetical protein